jgi:hypothetical protein
VIIALALVCFSLGACGGSSNSGTTAASGSSVASDGHGSTQGASSSSAAGTTSAQGKPGAASGAPKSSGTAAVPSYSLVGGCLLVGSTRTCDLPQSLVRDHREPAVEKAIDAFVSCLDKRGASSKSLSGCRYELVSDVVLRRYGRRPPS